MIKLIMSRSDRMTQVEFWVNKRSSADIQGKPEKVRVHMADVNKNKGPCAQNLKHSYTK
jgi:hypothetical protein